MAIFCVLWTISNGYGMYVRARSPGQVTLQLGIAVDPVIGVLVLSGERLRLVGYLSITLHNAGRCWNARGRSKRDEGSGRHARVLVGIDTGLRHDRGTRFMGLQIPVRLVVGLPDAG